MLALAAKGFVIGILVSAPMGPIGMLCIQRTLSKGRWHGFITGLGAMVSDIVYAILTSLGMGVVVNFVEANQAPLQLGGSLVLAVFGYYIYQSNPVKNLRKQKERRLSFTQDFITAFLLTFSNVLIVLLYIGLFARFGFILPDHSVGMSRMYRDRSRLLVAIYNIHCIKTAEMVQCPWHMANEPDCRKHYHCTFYYRCCFCIAHLLYQNSAYIKMNLR